MKHHFWIYGLVYVKVCFVSCFWLPCHFERIFPQKRRTALGLRGLGLLSTSSKNNGWMEFLQKRKVVSQPQKVAPPQKVDEIYIYTYIYKYKCIIKEKTIYIYMYVYIIFLYTPPKKFAIHHFPDIFQGLSVKTLGYIFFRQDIKNYSPLTDLSGEVCNIATSCRSNETTGRVTSDLGENQHDVGLQIVSIRKPNQKHGHDRYDKILRASSCLLIPHFLALVPSRVASWKSGLIHGVIPSDFSKETSAGCFLSSYLRMWIETRPTTPFSFVMWCCSILAATQKINPSSSSGIHSIVI